MGLSNGSMIETRKQKNILVVCITFFAQTVANSLWTSLLSIYLFNIGLSSIWIGVVFTVQSACMSLTYMPFGRFSDKIGRKTPLIIGNLLVTLATFLMLFANVPISFIIVLAIFGVGSGLITPAISALIAESVQPARAGMAFAVYYIATLLATVIGSAFSGILVSSIGYVNIFISAAIISLFVTSTLFGFISETKKTTYNTYRSAIKDSVKSSLPDTVRLLRSNKDLLMLTISLCIHSFGASMMNPYMSLFASKAINLDIVQVGIVISLFNIGQLIAQIPSGTMTDKIGARLTLLNHVLFSSLTWVLYTFSQDFVTALATMFIFGVNGALDMPARRSIMVEFSKDVGKATLIGSIDSLTGLVGMLAQFVGGTLWEEVGYFAPFYVGAIINAIAVPFLIILVKRERRTIKKLYSKMDHSPIT